MNELFLENAKKINKFDANVTRLYALLQGLFVSIDSLYSLSYGIINSKESLLGSMYLAHLII